MVISGVSPNFSWRCEPGDGVHVLYNRVKVAANHSHNLLLSLSVAAMDVRSPGPRTHPEDAAVAALERAVADLEAQAASEAATSSELEASIAREEAALVAKRQERQDVERRLAQQQRFEQREEGVAKLLELQLQVQQQVSAVAGSLSQVSNAESAWMPGALKQREQEVDALSSALKRQQKISHDAHRELLKLSAAKKRAAAGGSRAAEQALRATLAEMETARMLAEARADELAAQVRLLEEQGLRLRLHPPPPPDGKGHAPRKPKRVIVPSARGGYADGRSGFAGPVR